MDVGRNMSKLNAQEFDKSYRTLDVREKTLSHEKSDDIRITSSDEDQNSHSPDQRGSSL